MKIAIDISPLQTGHKVRGAGFYVEHLKKSLLKYQSQNKYTFFTRGEKLPKDIDVVHFPYFEPFFLARPIYKKYKTVVTVHDLTPIVFPSAFLRGIKGEIKWQMQKHALKKANAIITDSNCSKKDICKFINIVDSKVSVVNLAAGEEFQRFRIDDLRFKRIRNKYNLPEKFVLYVGDVTWNKNLPRFIRAVKQLELPLVLVGKALVEKDFDKNNPWNKDQLELEQLTETDKNITKLGFLPTEDLVLIYNLATVFAMPSLYEGFGLPVLEAMACGCPVITSMEGSLSEVAGEAAFSVDPYSQDSIANGIKKVYWDKSLQKELSEKGLERVKEFSWERTAKETEGIYRKVIG